MKQHRASRRKPTPAAALPYAPAPAQPPAQPDTLWQAALTALLATGLAFGLYATTAAPGLTWAHFGADGGDLLAAAMTGGVPHPSGYPLYMALLQGWLRLGQWLVPQADPARLGNLFSALCAALTAGVTVAVVLHLLRAPLLRDPYHAPRRTRSRWARPYCGRSARCSGARR